MVRFWNYVLFGFIWIWIEAYIEELVFIIFIIFFKILLLLLLLLLYYYYCYYTITIPLLYHYYYYYSYFFTLTKSSDKFFPCRLENLIFDPLHRNLKSNFDNQYDEKLYAWLMKSLPFDPRHTIYYLLIRSAKLFKLQRKLTEATKPLLIVHWINSFV